MTAPVSTTPVRMPTMPVTMPTMPVTMTAMMTAMTVTAMTTTCKRGSRGKEQDSRDCTNERKLTKHWCLHVSSKQTRDAQDGFLSS